MPIYKGKKYSWKELTRISGICRQTLAGRKRRGLTLEEAMELPIGAKLPPVGDPGIRAERSNSKSRDIKNNNLFNKLLTKAWR